MVKLLPYHVLLAGKSLRRDPGMSIIMLVALALGAGTWSLAVSQYTRFQAYEVRLPASLHQVEILRPHDANSVFSEGAATNPYMWPTALLGRAQVSYPEMQALIASRAPRRHSVGIRSEVIVRGPDRAAEIRIARFTSASFFAMFERPFESGTAWRDDEDAGGTGTVVLGLATGRALFPRGDAVGKTVFVEGRPFRVAGVLGRYQPLNAPWQLLLTGGSEDAVFLPLGEFNRLSVWPEQPLFRSPIGRAREDLLASDALFATVWVDLPTERERESYRHDLDQVLGPGRYVLRSLAEWRRDLAMPASQISFFFFLGVVVLLGGGFNLARWLLTRGLSRGPELGVFRALGAPRSSLFWRVVAEAALLAFPAALLAPLAAVPTVWLFNRYVQVVDMPLEVGPVAVIASIVPAFLVCMLGALYPAWRLARTSPTVYLGAT